VTRYIGKKISSRRNEISMDLTALAGSCGLTPAQLNKYESGISCVDAALLYDIAGVLGIGMAAFFDGLS